MYHCWEEAKRRLGSIWGGVGPGVWVKLDLGEGREQPIYAGFSLAEPSAVPLPDSWDPRRGLKLTWRPGDSWFGRIRLPANLAFEAKVK